MHKLLTFAGRCNLVHMQFLDSLLFWWLLSFVVCICVEREREKSSHVHCLVELSFASLSKKLPCITPVCFNGDINYPCFSRIMVESSGGTLGAPTFTCETWYSLLCVTSPAPGDINLHSSSKVYNSL